MTQWLRATQQEAIFVNTAEMNSRFINCMKGHKNRSQTQQAVVAWEQRTKAHSAVGQSQKSKIWVDIEVWVTSEALS